MVLQWTDQCKTMNEPENREKVMFRNTYLCFCLQIPSKESNHSLGDFFTISTWMQHGEEKKDGHKEHILCNSDGDSKYSC